MNKIFEKLAAMSMQQALILAVIIGACYYMFIFDDGSSLKASISATESLLNEERAKEQKTTESRREADRMRESLKTLGQQYEEVAKRLPSLLTSVDLSKSIDEFARTSAVSVKLKRTGNVEKKELVDEIPVDVILEGTYNELAQFIYFISSAERLTRIRSFSIEADQNVLSTKLKLDGQVVGYKLAEDKKGAEVNPNNSVQQ